MCRGYSGEPLDIGILIPATATILATILASLVLQYNAAVYRQPALRMLASRLILPASRAPDIRCLTGRREPGCWHEMGQSAACWSMPYFNAFFSRKRI